MLDVSPPAVLGRFSVDLRVTIRPGVEDDLPELEWFGMFTEHREIIRATFRRQQRGENLMLIADANGFPAGQVWIDFAHRRRHPCAFLWAVRVFPAFQRTGIGTRLMAAAERVVVDRGFTRAELTVERDNAKAMRFYGRIGYRVVGAERDSCEYTTPDGVPMRVPLDQLVFRKELAG